MLPPDEDAAADEAAEEEAEPVEEGAEGELELLHAARAPGTAASPAAVASPLIAERREKAPDLAGLAGLSVMATPCGNGRGIENRRTEQHVVTIKQSITRGCQGMGRCTRLNCYEGTGLSPFYGIPAAR